MAIILKSTKGIDKAPDRQFDLAIIECLNWPEIGVQWVSQD